MVDAVPMPVSWSIPSIGWTANTGSLDPYGSYWSVIDDTGWRGSPHGRTGRIGRPSSQGMYRVPVYKDARIVTLGGYLESPTEAAREQSELLLASAFSSGSLQELHCTQVTGEMYGLFELDADILITPLTPFCSTWTLQVASPDPRKYAAAASSGSTTLPFSTGGLDWSTGGGLNWSTGGGLSWGSTTSNGTIGLTNVGTADTWPTFTIAAGANPLVTPSITLSYGGSVLFYNDTLSPGDQLVITTNPSGRGVVLNLSSDRKSSMTTAGWQSIPANSTTTATFSAAAYSSTATLTATWANAYW